MLCWALLSQSLTSRALKMAFTQIQQQIIKIDDVAAFVKPIMDELGLPSDPPGSGLGPCFHRVQQYWRQLCLRRPVFSFSGADEMPKSMDEHLRVTAAALKGETVGSLTAAAEAGDPAKMLLLHDVLQFQLLGVARDFRTACDWSHRAAYSVRALEHPECLVNQAAIYHHFIEADAAKPGPPSAKSTEAVLSALDLLERAAGEDYVTALSLMIPRWAGPCFDVKKFPNLTQKLAARDREFSIERSSADAEFEATPELRCWNTRCSVVVTRRSMLKLCGGCKTARYCSKSCQKEAWSEHKAECKRIRRDLAKQGASGAAKKKEKKYGPKKKKAFRMQVGGVTVTSRGGCKPKHMVKAQNMPVVKADDPFITVWKQQYLSSFVPGVVCEADIASAGLKDGQKPTWIWPVVIRDVLTVGNITFASVCDLDGKIHRLERCFLRWWNHEAYYAHSASTRGSVRFKVGQKVQACVSGRWVDGIVVALYYEEEGWADGRWAPYQILSDCGQFCVYSPVDSDSWVRSRP